VRPHGLGVRIVDRLREDHRRDHGQKDRNYEIRTNERPPHALIVFVRRFLASPGGATPGRVWRWGIVADV
jgi:hypothetical protein